jgi:hypothetical protein
MEAPQTLDGFAAYFFRIGTVGWDAIPASACEHAGIASQPSNFDDTQHSLATRVFKQLTV